MAGSLCALYGHGLPYVRRARAVAGVVLGMAAGLAVSLTTASLTGSTAVLIAVGALLAAAQKAVCDATRIGPPGHVIFTFVSSAALFAPQRPEQIPGHLALTLGAGAFAWLVALAPALVRREGPERRAVARALEAAAACAADPGPRTRGAAAAAVHAAWQCLLASGRPTPYAGRWSAWWCTPKRPSPPRGRAPGERSRTCCGTGPPGPGHGGPSPCRHPRPAPPPSCTGSTPNAPPCAARRPPRRPPRPARPPRPRLAAAARRRPHPGRLRARRLPLRRARRRPPLLGDRHRRLPLPGQRHPVVEPDPPAHPRQPGGRAGLRRRTALSGPARSPSSAAASSSASPPRHSSPATTGSAPSR